MLDTCDGVSECSRDEEDSSDEDDVEMEIDSRSRWDSDASGSSEEDKESCTLPPFPIVMALVFTQLYLTLS